MPPRYSLPSGIILNMNCIDRLSNNCILTENKKAENTAFIVGMTLK